MKNFLKNVMAIFVTVIVLSACSTFAEAYQFGSNEYCEVVINQDLMKQSNRRYIQAKVRFNIYRIVGNVKKVGQLNKSDKVRVIMKDKYNNIIWQGDKSSCMLGLGNDHDIYRIYALDRKGRTVACSYWTLEPVSGCRVRER